MKRPISFFILAGIAAMLAALMVYSALQRREAELKQAKMATVRIVVAAHDLTLGTKLDSGSVKLAEWPRNNMPPGAFTDPNAVTNSYIRSSFVANEPIVASKLFMGQTSAGVMPLLIPAGMRAMSVPVDEVSDIAGFVLPHSHVDVLVAVSGAGEGQKPYSKLVLEDVEVLAVAQEIEGKKTQPQVVKVVTLLVTPQEAERLALASREGTLRLAMRSYNDNKIVLTSGTDMKQLLSVFSTRAPTITAQAAVPIRHFRHAPRRSNRLDIEILRNGKSSESVSFVREAGLAQLGSEPARRHQQARRVWDRGKKLTSAGERPDRKTASADDPVTRTLLGESAAASLTETSATVPEASYAPHAKTLDIPWGGGS
jgi:pilus assembly protein CpaB